MTHYKEDEIIARAAREASGFDAFHTSSVTTIDAHGDRHTELSQHVETSASGGEHHHGLLHGLHLGRRRSSASSHTHSTYTEAADPLIHTTHPIVLTSAGGVLHDVVQSDHSSFGATAERVASHDIIHDLQETPEAREKRLKEEVKYQNEKDRIAREHEEHMAKVTGKYLGKTEHEAEKIRKELEKQYKRDIDYRKELVEDSVKRQKQELELEAKFAKKELERERELATSALELSKTQTDVQVNLNTAAGHTTTASHTTVHRTEK